jgi:hypothetical protein
MGASPVICWGHVLRREECGGEARTAEEARGWRAMLTGDPPDYEDVSGHAHDDEDPAVALYGPDCAKREFG